MREGEGTIRCSVQGYPNGAQARTWCREKRVRVPPSKRGRDQNASFTRRKPAHLGRPQSPHCISILSTARTGGRGLSRSPGCCSRPGPVLNSRQAPPLHPSSGLLCSFFPSPAAFPSTVCSWGSPSIVYPPCLSGLVFWPSLCLCCR